MGNRSRSRFQPRVDHKTRLELIEFCEVSRPLLRTRPRLSRPLRMFRFRNVSVANSKTVGLTPLKPRSCEIRDRGVFSCANRDITAKHTQYHESPQRVASSTRHSVGTGCHKQRQPRCPDCAWMERSNAQSLCLSTETIPSGYVPRPTHSVGCQFSKKASKKLIAGLYVSDNPGITPAHRQSRGNVGVARLSHFPRPRLKRL